jgi:hypothetical protein
MKISTRFLLLSLAAIAAMQTKAQTTSTTAAPYTQRTNIPTLYVNTESGKDPVDKVTYLPCTIRYVDGTTTTTYNLTTGGIRGRGNSTWSADKKPWRLKFDDKVAFLGSDYATASSWTLLANTYDKSLMRNALTYYLGEFVELPFCPSARFVDLVMNGDYKGTYQISDQMEVRKKRVDISKTGWMFEYANASDKVDEPKIQTAYGYVQVKNPDFTNDDLSTNTTLSDAMKTYLNTTLYNAIKTSNTGDSYINPNTGYRSLVDPTTLINWYIATEITANWDGFYSVYSYREADGPLCLGPMWDEDLAYGNHTETYDYFSNFYGNLLAFNNFDQSQFPNGYRKLQPVIAHLYDDPWFVNAVDMRFNELVNKGIEKNLLDNIESMRTLLSQSAAQNFSRWDIYKDDPGYAERNQSSWDGYVTALKTFITNRLTTLKTLFDAKNTNNRYLDENTAYPSATATTTSTRAGSYINVIMNRTAKANMWNTVCFPFPMTKTLVEYMFGSGTVVEEFENVVNTDGSITLNFKTTNSVITAGKPYLVRPTRDVTVPYVFLDLGSLLTSPTPVTKKLNGNGDEYSFVGIFSPTTLKTDGTNLFVGTGNTLLTSTSGALKGYRAYFVIPSTNAGAKMLMSFDDVVDGIHTVNADGTSTSKIYNINGQYVGTSKEGLAKGIYIVNGKKVVIK